MNCNEVIPLLSPLHDGELDFEQRQAVAAHLRSCVECSGRLGALRRLTDLSCQTPSPAPPATLLAKIERLIGDGTRNESGRRSYVRSRTAAAILIASAAAVLGGLIVWQLASGPPQSHVEMVRVFGEFLRAYEQGNINAAAMLAQEYQGTSVSEAEAASALNHQTVTRDTVLSSHQVAKRYLLKMPCCDCVQTIYTCDGKTSFIVFEHTQEELEWFEGRSVVRTECRGKSCCVVELKRSLAASWRVDSGYVTVVGVRDLTQLDEFVGELRSL